MKLVINRCFGGFSLSPEATERYAKRKGAEEVFFFSGILKDQKLVPKEEVSSLFWTAGKTNTPWQSPDNWHELTSEEKDAWNKAYNDWYCTSRPEDRADPDLIAVVEELGSEAASGRCAELAIVEIPDDVEYTVEEYDGLEHVAEKHRTWN